MKRQKNKSEVESDKDEASNSKTRSNPDLTDTMTGLGEVSEHGKRLTDIQLQGRNMLNELLSIGDRVRSILRED